MNASTVAQGATTSQKIPKGKSDGAITGRPASKPGAISVVPTKVTPSSMEPKPSVSSASTDEIDPVVKAKYKAPPASKPGAVSLSTSGTPPVKLARGVRPLSAKVDLNHPKYKVRPASKPGAVSLSTMGAESQGLAPRAPNSPIEGEADHVVKAKYKAPPASKPGSVSLSTSGKAPVKLARGVRPLSAKVDVNHPKYKVRPANKPGVVSLSTMGAEPRGIAPPAPASTIEGKADHVVKAKYMAPPASKPGAVSLSTSGEEPQGLAHSAPASTIEHEVDEVVKAKYMAPPASKPGAVSLSTRGEEPRGFAISAPAIEGEVDHVVKAKYKAPPPSKPGAVSLPTSGAEPVKPAPRVCTLTTKVEGGSVSKKKYEGPPANMPGDVSLSTIGTEPQKLAPSVLAATIEDEVSTMGTKPQVFAHSIVSSTTQGEVDPVINPPPSIKPQAVTLSTIQPEPKSQVKARIFLPKFKGEVDPGIKPNSITNSTPASFPAPLYDPGRSEVLPSAANTQVEEQFPTWLDEPVQKANDPEDLKVSGFQTGNDPHFGKVEDNKRGIAVAVPVEEEEEHKNLQTAEEYDESLHPKFYKRTCFICSILCVLILGLAVGLGAGIPLASGISGDSQVALITSEPTHSPIASPTSAPTTAPPTSVPTLPPTTTNEVIFREKLIEVISERAIAFSPIAFDNAITWYANEDPQYDRPDYNLSFPEYERSHFVQRFVLIWIWMHSTQNGVFPWRTCNPARPELNETDVCVEDAFAGVDNDGEILFYDQRNSTRYMASTNECEWVHVFCLPNSRDAFAVVFIGNEMSGSFPVFISELSSLLQVIISWNSLTGTLPPEVELMQNLIYLELINNTITGPIPQEVYNMTNLEYLILGQNAFSGTISTRVGQLQSLQELNINGHGLMHGTLPTELGFLTQLRDLRFQQQNFSASTTIPTEIGELVNLQLFWIFESGIVGNIPQSFTNLEKLTSLRLQRNGLTGTIPNLVLPIVSSFEVSRNKLTGQVPDTIYQNNDNQMSVFAVHENFLNGTISEDIMNFQDIQFLILAENSFTGPIPSAIQNMTNLAAIWLFLNKFEGPIPDEICLLRDGNLQFLLADCLGETDREAQNPCFCCTTCCDPVSGSCIGDIDSLDFFGFRQLETTTMIRAPRKVHKQGTSLQHLSRPDARPTQQTIFSRTDGIPS